MKKHSGCDGMMDCENSIADIKYLESTKTKIINTCAPYELFKNFKYNKDTNKLEAIISTDKNITAKERQYQAFFNIHKNMFLENETDDEFITRIAEFHLIKIGCEWCSKNDDLVIDHKHIVSSIYGDKHLGLYRGPLCFSCNKIESICKTKSLENGKKNYLQTHKYGPETIEYIIKHWYSS